MASMNIPVSTVIIGSGEAWLPYIQISEEIEKVMANPTAETLEDLEQWLNLHQANFRSLLTTKEKNSKEREYLKTGVSEPISFRLSETKQLLPSTWVAETLLLSDVLDINEFQALDLLLTGEAEIFNYPCWSRGLVAVNMYYEGQHALISALHSMVRLCPGLTWGSRVSHKVLDIVKPFLDKVFTDNLVDRILELLPRFEVQKQMDTLDSNLGLGDWRHRTEILKHMTSIRIELAQIIFCIAAQQRLSWKNTLRILEYLRHIELKRDVKFYKEHILLIVSVVYGLDNNLSGENFDKSYGMDFRKYINDADNNKTFLCFELLEFLNLAYHTCVYKLLADLTINYNPMTPGRPTFGKGLDTSNDLLGDEELEFRTDVFTFLKIEIFTNESAEVSEEEHVMRRFHTLFTDFIINMPMKVKDMKVRSEDAAKTVLLYLEQGIARPPHLSVEYESFLECLAAFYSLDSEYQLAESFFSPDRQSLSLSKFTRSLCHDSPPMFVCNTKMMTGLGHSHPSGTFEVIKHNGHNLSLEHFFDSIMKYLASFGTPASTTGPIFQSDAFQRVVLDSMKVTLSPHEVNGIVAYLQLLQNVCAEKNIKHYFVDTKRHWIKLILMSTKIRTLPREMRAEMLKAVAAMIPTENLSHETVVSLWDIFYSCHLIEPGSGDFRDELEEKETRLESYILCNGFLKLLDVLVRARYATQKDLGFDENGYGVIHGDKESLDNYVAYVRDAVLLKLAYRTYRNIPERWETATLCISIVSRLLDAVPILMVQLLSDSPVLKSVLTVLVECTKVREMSTGKIPHVDKTSWEVLNLIYQVVLRQDTFLRKSAKLVRGAVLFGIHDLLVSVSISTGRAEYLFALLKFIDKFNPEDHQNLSLQILTVILSEHSETDVHLYAGITRNHRLALILGYTFSQCLTNPNCSEDIKKNILKLLRCSVVHTAPNLGFFLLGVDKKMDFQGLSLDKSQTSKSILYYILQKCNELPDVFLTLLVILRDDRLRDSLLRHLRGNQFFVKYYIDSFSCETMELKDIGYFLKCLSIELKYAQHVGPLAHVLLLQNSNKFLSILERVDLIQDEIPLPQLEFFEHELVVEAMMGCDYFDRDFKVKLVDLKRLEDIFEDQINKLEKSTTLRLKKSVTGEAKELLDYARKQNDLRRREASKVILFDAWKQCLEVLVFIPSTLKLAGMDFVTSLLRLVVDKVTNTEGTTESFMRLAAETVLSLCGVLNEFKEDLSETMLNLILTYLCSWTSTETSVSVRALLYPSILNIMGIMKTQKKSVTSKTNFAVIVDGLCKDCCQSVDTGKISSMYLLGEIIHWSMRNGFGGSLPYVDVNRPITFGPQILGSSSDRTSKSIMSDDDISPTQERQGRNKLSWQDISIIKPPVPVQNFLFSPTDSNTTKHFNTSFKDDQLNSTALPMDVRDKQYFLPGDWQSTAKDSSFFGFQQKELKPLDISFQMEDDLNGSINFATQNTVMNYMQTRGLLMHLIHSLSHEDDVGLLDFFNAPVGSIHLRAMLIFNARLHMFSRFARTGVNGALILLENNIIPRLTDMHSFKMATRLNLWSVDEYESGTNERHEETSIEAQMTKSTASHKVSHLDSLFAAVLGLFHCLDASLPKNSTVASQIWQFLIMNKDSSINLLTRCLTEKETNTGFPEAVLLLTSLLAKIGHKIPSNAILPNDDIFDKVMDTLKRISQKNSLTNGEALIVKDLLQFLFNHATNPSALTETKRTLPCRIVLFPSMTSIDGDKESIYELTIGNVLRLILMAAFRIPNWDGPESVLLNLILICELGLTLAYWHIDIELRQTPSTTDEGPGVNNFKSHPVNLQVNLAHFMEESFVKTVTDAFEEQRATSKSYVETMISRIRRLAHLKSP